MTSKSISLRLLYLSATLLRTPAIALALKWSVLVWSEEAEGGPELGSAESVILLGTCISCAEKKQKGITAKTNSERYIIVRCRTSKWQRLH